VDAVTFASSIHALGVAGPWFDAGNVDIAVVASRLGNGQLVLVSRWLVDVADMSIDSDEICRTEPRHFSLGKFQVYEPGIRAIEKPQPNLWN
jgi:hypothetical protein